MVTIFARIAAGAPNLPGTGYVLTLPLTIEGVTFSLLAQGGDESAEIVGTAPVRSARAWLDALQSDVVITDRHGRRVWRGFIETAEVDDGAMRSSQTIDGLANDVRVSYTRYGGTKTTAAAQNTASLALYGYHQVVVNEGEMTTTEAEARRDAYLTASAWPRGETSASLQRGQTPGTATVTLRCRGWLAALGWVLLQRKQQASVVGVTTPSVLRGLTAIATSGATASGLANSNAYGVGIDSTTFTGPTTRASLYTYFGFNAYLPPTKGYENVGDLFAALVARGTDSGERIAYGLRSDIAVGATVAHMLLLRTWAGAAPTTITYTLTRGGALLGPAQTPVPWATVRPDAMVRIAGYAARPQPGTAVDTASRFYLNRVTYGWRRGQGESLTLEPLSGADMATYLTRVR